eukprot:11860656-Alexandrium_andersonii.AAC.1
MAPVAQTRPAARRATPRKHARGDRAHGPGCSAGGGGRGEPVGTPPSAPPQPLHWGGRHSKGQRQPHRHR